MCDGKPVPLLRNHRYIVNVVAVSGPGAARPEDATSENLTAEITVDDQNSAMDIVTDGHYYLGLNPRMLFFNGLGYPTETQYEGDLSTDAPAWTAALSEDYPKNWSSKYVLVDPSGGAGKNRRFVRVNDGTQDGRLPELVSDARQATVRVTAGNLADSLTIIQSPVTAEDFPFVRRTGVVRLLRNGSTRAGLYRLPVRFDGMESGELLAFGKRRSGAFVLSRRDVGRVRRRHSGQRSAAGEGVPRSEGAVQHV